MTNKDRIKNYAKQLGVSTTGAFKNSTATRKFIADKLTSRQQRRLRKKAANA
jgi:hypothetical protein